MENSYCRVLEKEETISEYKFHSGEECAYCGADVPQGSEWCPSCGKKLVSYCTFCGADIPSGENECPECGNSVDGIICPTCGARSFRGFCSNCNEPLTRLAKKTVEKALQDESVQEIKELLDEIENLKAEIAEETATLSVQPQSESEVAPEQKKKSPLLLKKQERIQHLSKDINKIFAEMLPPAGATPQEKRNYYSARLIAVSKTVKATQKVPVGWVCNLCGCRHSFPSQCAAPELGGRWIYDTTVVQKTVTSYQKISD